MEIFDQVQGGCFTNSATIKDALELVFRRNGIKVNDDKLSDLFIVSAYGQRAQSKSGGDLGCNVSLNAELRMSRLVLIPYGNGNTTFTTVTHWVAGSLNGGADAQNTAIKDFAVASAEKLTNEILRSRDEVFPEWPEIKASFEAAQ